MVNFLTSDSENTIGCQRTHAYCNRIDGEKKFSKKSSHIGEKPGIRFCNTLFEINIDDVMVMTHTHDT